MKIEQLALSFLKGVGLLRAHRLLEVFGSAAKAFEADATAWQRAGMTPGICRNLPSLKKEALERAEKEIDLCRKKHIWILPYEDKAYPAILKTCLDAPLTLYGAGNLNLDFGRSISLVGSRHASQYGRTQTAKTVEELRGCLRATVSGLALGIDTEAHRISLKCGIPTVAVLGNSLESVYPESNRDLAKQIVEEGGAVISEMPLFTPITAGVFPRRNRIIAGLAQATVLVESALNGGAMHTANAAESYQRLVFAVPGRNDSYYSQGCNRLIAMGKAQLLCDSAHIKMSLGWEPTEQAASPAVPEATGRTFPLFGKNAPPETVCGRKRLENMNHEKILRILDIENPAGWELLLSKSGQSPQTLSSSILEMEIAGLIRALPGNFYEKV